MCDQHNSSRRELLKSLACGFGYLALAGLCGEKAAAEGRVNPDRKSVV